jgi:AraC-like DNA-binding protein
MNYNIAKPGPFLSQYVKQYWTMEHCHLSSTEHTQRIVPCGLFEVIFYLSGNASSSNGDTQMNETIMVSGQQKGYYDIRISGSLSLFAIYFHPHGLSLLLDLPLTELYNQSIPLKLLLKDKISNLEDDLFENQSFEQRIAIAEKFLIAHFQRTEQKYQYENIKHAVNIINRHQGMIEVDELASHSCLSRKQFERVFSAIIGTTPKQFLKIVRFQNAIYQKSKQPDISLTQIALNCGYYDQAHMINDFKSLSGFTPKQFFSDCQPFSDYFE